MQFFSSSMNFLEHFYFLFFFIAETTFQGCFPKRYLKFQKKKAYNHVNEYVWSRKLINKSWVSYIRFSEVLTLFYKTLSAGYFWICPCDNIIVTILLSQYVIFAVRFKMTLFFIGRKIIILNLQLRLIFSETKREKHFLDVVKVGRGIRRILT